MRGQKRYPICACCLSSVYLECDVYVCRNRECADGGWSPYVVEVTEHDATLLRKGRRIANSQTGYNHALELKQRDEAHYKELCEALGVKD